MESWKDRVATEARVNMTLGAVHQVASIAIIAIIVFGDIANAESGVKRLVAFAAVLGAITSWIFTSNGLKSYQDGSKEMTAAEAATASGKNLSKQPFAIYQIYTLAVTIATIAVTLTAIY
ncbi:MAG: hypothetical protein WCH38_05755 [Actinomycetota bacterium]